MAGLVSTDIAIKLHSIVLEPVGVPLCHVLANLSAENNACALHSLLMHAIGSSLTP